MDSNQQLQLTGQVLSGGSQVQTPIPGKPVCIPIADADVTLYRTTANAPAELGSTSTDEEGRFSMDLSIPSGSGIFYLAATRPDLPGMRFVAVVGPMLAGPVTLNELTTVAAAYAFAQFTAQGAISGPVWPLGVAAGMCANLASATGEPSRVMLDPPNADQTNSLRSLRSLANLLAWSVREGGWTVLQTLTTPPQGQAPADTFQAMVNVARHPAWHTSALYQQSQALQMYTPALALPPDAWTLAVKVNRTGNDPARQFGGPANISWDQYGNAWIANNVFQGTPNGCDFVVVLKPNGMPADGLNGQPKSPVVGGGMNGPGYGVAVDENGYAWVGSFGWGPSDTFPTVGVVSKFDQYGRNVGGSGYTQGTSRVQGMAVGKHNNHLWLASYGNDEVEPLPPYLNTVSVYLNGNPGNCISYPAPNTSQTAPGTYTFGVAVDDSAEEPTAWVTYSGGLGWPQANPGHVARFTIQDDKVLQPTLTLQVGSVTKGIALDPDGNAWVASGGDNSVYMVTPDGRYTGFTDRGGLCGPWGVAVDGDGDVWVANFGYMGVTRDYTNAGVTKLAGVRSPSRLPVGEPISPETGYTLPTAGDPVTLPDGSNLYDDGTPCYSPLMRMTSVTIDAAGNLWAVNNWKPRFGTDFPPGGGSAGGGNPGGDGIVIFVGIAKPPAGLG